jgi:hypothetical protein
MSSITQEYRLTKVGELSPHPDNPRRGDVAAIAASVEANGFYGAVVAQLGTGHVLAGNHRLLAAQQGGAEEIPVIWVDVDDDRAKRILLADNKTSDVGGYDEAALAELLTDLSGLVGTGYTADELEDLLIGLEEPVDPESQSGPSRPQRDGDPVDGGGEGIDYYDRKDRWTEVAQRILVLNLPLPLYVWVQDRLNAVAEELGTDSNVATIVAILSERSGENPPDA